MRLTKKQRAELFDICDGRCAYCGEHLSVRWCADHVDPVIRQTRYERGKGFVQTGEVLHPQRDTIENLLPSCQPCNIHKRDMSLEGWRHELGKVLDVLNRNYPTYRTALRFGIVEEAARTAVVKFYFERRDAHPYAKCAAKVSP